MQTTGVILSGGEMSDEVPHEDHGQGERGPGWHRQYRHCNHSVRKW